MKGTYTLLMSCRMPFKVRIANNSSVNITKGRYLYTGSALGRGGVSLAGRIERHFRSAKPVNWHVDHFTAHARCEVLVAVGVRSGKRLECVINNSILRHLPTTPAFPGAGATDCRCEGHLLKIQSKIGFDEILDTLLKIHSAHGEVFFFLSRRNLDRFSFFPAFHERILEDPDQPLVSRVMRSIVQRPRHILFLGCPN